MRADDLRCPTTCRPRSAARCGARSPSTASRSTRSRRISAVDGGTVTYDVHTEARPVAKEVLERSVAQKLAQAGAPAGTASCAGDLPAQVGATVACTLTGADGAGDLDASGPPPWTAARSTTPSSRRVRHDRDRQPASGRVGRHAGARGGRRARRRAARSPRTTASRSRSRASSAPTAADCPTDLKGESGPVDRLQGDQGRRGRSTSRSRSPPWRATPSTSTSSGSRRPDRRSVAPTAPPRTAADVAPSARRDRRRQVRRAERPRPARGRRQAGRPGLLPGPRRAGRGVAAVHPHGRHRDLRRDRDRDERAGHRRQVRHPGRPDAAVTAPSR